MAYCFHCMEELMNGVCTACGKNPKEVQTLAHHLPVASILNGKYLVGSALGEGGFGITYIGRDLNLDLKVAIKEYYPSGMVNRNASASRNVTVNMNRDEDTYLKGKKNFLSEARSLAKFANESSVVMVRDFFEENETAYIVMDYVEGEDLRTYLKRRGPMSYGEAYTMLLPIMGALKKVHAQGLIHRDISPSNIMVQKDGSAKLLDFGAVRAVNAEEIRTLSVLYKPGYAPEEQYRTKGIQGPWTDVYALSATFYKMVTGITPDDAMNRMYMDEVQPPSYYNSGITKEQSAVIMKGMAVYQKDRFENMDQLQRACHLAVLAYNTGHTVDAEKTVSENTYWGSFEQEDEPKTVPEPQPIPEKPSLEKKPEPERVIPVPEKKPARKETATGAKEEKKKKKPSKTAFIFSLLFGIAGIAFVLLALVAFNTGYSHEEDGPVLMKCAMGCIIPSVALGFLYYPRLEKRVKTRLYTVYGCIAALAVVSLGVIMIFKTLTYVTIGDQKIKRNEENVSVFADMITGKDMEELASMKNLKQLSIAGCMLDDGHIKYLETMTQLEQLNISGNTDITDISPLEKLVNLELLNISNTGVSDISCLSSMKKLENLNINNTEVSDVSVLKELTALTVVYMNTLENLDISTVQVPDTLMRFECTEGGLTDLEFLRNASQISTVIVHNNAIKDLSPLQDKPLNSVGLNGNQITDLSPVAHASWGISANGNQIEDISCLQGYELSSLDLAENQISDIQALSDNSKLTFLNLANNQLSDISPLKECFNIMDLNLAGNQIQDISVLEYIDNLKSLDLTSNQVQDITALAENPGYYQTDRTIYLANNQIQDISPLASFNNCSYMYLDNNQIQDLSPIASCSALKVVQAAHNQITKLPAFKGSKMHRLHVEGNPVTDVESLVLRSGSSSLDSSWLSITYNEEINWQWLSNAGIKYVDVYDVPERDQQDFRNMGFTVKRFEN